MPRSTNQYLVNIKKTPCAKNFLQINNDEWQGLAKNCDNPSALKLYMYLAANEINYKFALSQVAVENALGFKKSAYHKAIDTLKELGYLIEVGKDQYNFYTTPKKIVIVDETTNEENSTIADKIAIEEKSLTAENSAIAEKIASVENSVNTFNF